ncbi:MAG: radical SAM protein [Planctomycetes bacterium]|nr:radical SAM protein [Planctomycetota bacterium]
MIVPKHLDIANVYGRCNANCDMCAMKAMKARPGIMSNEVFETIITKFCDKNIGGIITINLVGIGESLLDPGLAAKISYARSMGFNSICVPTNVSLLDEKKSRELLDAGLAEVVFGIDSIEREVYERIRTNLNFEAVMQNAHRFIEMRDAGNYATKIYVRIIEQELTSKTDADYIAYWTKYLNVDNGDMVLRFPKHNWADSPLPIEKDCVCPYIFDRMVIDAWGNVQFCCIDVESDFFDLGNVLKDDPVELFNSETFTRTRNLMKDGKINDIAPCRHCDVPLKRLDRGILQ